MGCGQTGGEDVDMPGEEDEEWDSEIDAEEKGERLDFEGNHIGLYDRAENRPEEGGEFKPVENIEGEEFLAVRPWLGQFQEPTNPPEHDSSPPDQNLSPAYVYGYRCADIRHNLYYTNNCQDVVYCIAAIGVTLNKASKDQTLFGCGDASETKGHGDDIISLGISTDRTRVATGETGKRPKIFIWDAMTGEVQCQAKLGRVRGVKTIAWSKSGQYVACTALDNDHSVFVLDPNGKKKAKVLAQGKGGDSVFYDMAFSTVDEGTFVTVGKRPKYWTFENGMLTGKALIFGRAKRTTMVVAQYLENGKLICGGLNGYLYIFNGNNAAACVKHHRGAVFSISVRGNSLVTGGKDKTLRLFPDGNIKNKQCETIKLYHYARGLDQDPNTGTVLVGARDGVIYEYGRDGQMQQRLMCGHSDGEVWGLAIHPQETNIVITTADDNKICVWDTTKRERIGKGVINKKKGAKRKRGASTMSRFRPNQCSRAVAINCNNGHVAVSTNEGEVQIRASYSDIDNTINAFRDSKRWNEVMEYSPDGKYLAVGSHDQKTRVYDVDNNYQRIAVCKGHSSYIHCLDWSTDCEAIRTVCGAYELLYFTKDGMQQTSGASAYKDELWTTQAAKFGWYVDGIYPSGVDGTHVNGTDRSPDQQLIVTSTDYGEVNLFRNPCRMGSMPKIYVGHSEHVVRAKFDSQGQNVYSIGGQDKAFIHWNLS